jgi:hypothetical protein
MRVPMDPKLTDTGAASEIRVRPWTRQGAARSVSDLLQAGAVLGSPLPKGQFILGKDDFVIRQQPRFSFNARLYFFICLSLVAVFFPCLPSSGQENRWIPAALDQPIPPSLFGMHIHHAGSETPWPVVPFAEWRLWDASVAWPQLEPERGVWNFDTLDLYVDLAEKGRVELLLPLALSPTWASSRPTEPSTYSPGNAAEPEDLDDWRTYVRTVVTRYKGRIHEYEIWNEPDQTGFWTGTVTQMIDLTREAAEIVHDVDPAATVVSPSATKSEGVEWLREFLAAGGGKYVDVIGFHFYVMPAGPEAMVPLIDSVRLVMRQNGAGQKPLWNTETGWAYPKPFPSAELAAAYVVRSYLLAWWSGVKQFYWYAWDNHAWVSLYLTELDNATPTLAGRAYEIAQNWLVGAHLDACQQDSNDNWICQLKRGELTLWVVWNPDGAQSLDSTKLRQAASVTPLLGATGPLSGTNLDINEIPQLITTAQP